MTARTVSTQNAGVFAKLLLVVSIEPNEIGERLKAARRKRGWTQLELALEAGVSPATIQRWEAGKLPRVRELIRVAGLLEMPPEELVEPESDRQDAETNARLAHIERALERQAGLLREQRSLVRELIARFDQAEPEDRAAAS